MFRKLIANEWRQQIRSPYLSSSIVQKIILALMALLILFFFWVIGMAMDEVLEKVFPEADPIPKFNGLIIYYFIVDILMRFFMQQFPVISMRPYLVLPIKKNTLVHFLLLKSIPTFFNLLPLLLFLPFFIKVMVPAYTLAASIAWIVTLLSLILISNFFSFYLKKVFDAKPLVSLIYIVLFGSLYYLNSFGYLKLAAFSEKIMTTISSQVYLTLIPLTLLLQSYLVVFQFFRSRIYLDSLDDKKTKEMGSTSDWTLFSPFGKIGELMNLEMKMIWRNPRARTFFYSSIAFLFFPLTLLVEEYGMAYKLMIGIFSTGMFAIYYAHLLLSWNSTHFDYILTRKIVVNDLILAKYYLLSISVVVSYLLTLPFVFFIEDWLLIASVSMLFNIGGSIYFYMGIANYTSQRIDPGEGGVFNSEGIGALHYIIAIPMLAVPILSYWFLAELGYPMVGMAIIAILGLLGLLLHKIIIVYLMAIFEKRKYLISLTFRNK